MSVSKNIKPLVIAIAGGTASGKTTLVNAIVEAIGKRRHRLSANRLVLLRSKEQELRRNVRSITMISQKQLNLCFLWNILKICFQESRYKPHNITLHCIQEKMKHY